MDFTLINKRVDLEKNDGLSSFINHACQQHHGVFKVFHEFFDVVRPSNILEIGTALGGFTMYLKLVCDDLKLSSKILSYDIHRNSWYDDMIKEGVDVRVENIFNNDYSEVKPEVIEFIKQPGHTIVFCDGGSKKDEFKLLSKYLKKGDFILAHDYGENRQIFEEKIYKKVWNWCEITEEDIADAVLENNLLEYDKETFNNVAWTCKVKFSN